MVELWQKYGGPYRHASTRVAGLVILSLVKPTRNVEGTGKPLFFFLYLEGPSKGPKHRDLLVVLHSDATKFADIGRL